MLASLIVSLLLIAVAVAVRLSLRRTSRPRGLQNLAEAFVEGFYGLINSVTLNSEKSRRFFPLLTTFFLFILLNNWFGLLPFVGTVGKYESKQEASAEKEAAKEVEKKEVAPEVAPDAAHQTTTTQVAKVTQVKTEAKPEAEHAPEKVFVPFLRAATADLNLTLALGLISVVMIQVFGVQYVHLGYFKKFFNFSNPLYFAIGLLELILECAKVISFGFRLFGNIFAGEVLLAVISFLIPVVAPMPFYGLEIFVGLIQALVFAMLSLVFYNMATVGHDEH